MAELLNQPTILGNIICRYEMIRHFLFMLCMRPGIVHAVRMGWYTVVDLRPGDTNLFALANLCLLIMSSTTTDPQCCLAAAAFVNGPHFGLEWLIKIPEAELIQMLRPAGRQNVNCANIKAAASIIKKRFGGRVPLTVSDLISLPGVYTKIAILLIKQVLGESHGIAVDCHVVDASVALRFLTPQIAKNKELVRYVLERIIPIGMWDDFNEVLGSLGQLLSVKSNWPAVRECMNL